MKIVIIYQQKPMYTWKTCAIMQNVPNMDRTMREEINLAAKIEEKLPAKLAVFLQLVGRRTADRNEKAYIVGGVVRDLLLGKANLDIDLAVEGDAVSLAREMTGSDPDRITVHRQFNTAKIRWQDWNIDFATARSETYASPGALPTITPGSLDEDLLRRDFTINAMAIGLTGQGYGLLYDPCNGQGDLADRKIRILHDKSFIDDSTRIWRGLRYEQRLGFQIETHTLKLLKRDIRMLDTVSGDRINYEIECILKEEFPERVFKRAYELGVLKTLNPSLKGDIWLDERFSQAREISFPHHPSAALYWSLLAYGMDTAEKEKLVSYLRLPKPIVQTMRDSDSIKSRLKYLAAPKISNSEIYHLLYGYSLQAVIANIIAGAVEESQPNLVLYMDKLHSVKPILTGNDLLKMGITQGPVIKDLLNAILDARLDDKAKTREDEIQIVRKKLSG
jgi:tRNA nucleotidyltransferase (CCA-adding enzyme)